MLSQQHPFDSEAIQDCCAQEISAGLVVARSVDVRIPHLPIPLRNVLVCWVQQLFATTLLLLDPPLTGFSLSRSFLSSCVPCDFSWLYFSLTPSRQFISTTLCPVVLPKCHTSLYAKGIFPKNNHPKARRHHELYER